MAPKSDPEDKLQAAGDEFEERLERLDTKIDDAHKEAQARSLDTDAGAFDDPEADGEPEEEDE